MAGNKKCHNGLGFYPDERNCSRFYRCVDGLAAGCDYVILRYSCPAGMVFINEPYLCGSQYPPEGCFSRPQLSAVIAADESSPSVVDAAAEYVSGISSAPTSDGAAAADAGSVFVIFRRFYNCPNPGRFPFRLSCWFFIRCVQIWPARNVLQGSIDFVGHGHGSPRPGPSRGGR